MTDIPDIPTPPEGPGDDQRRWKDHFRRFSARTYAVIILVAALVGIGVPVWQKFGPHPAVYTFTDPSPDGVTQKSCAFTATGQGRPPTGQFIVVSNQVDDVGDNVDPFLHFGEATLMPNTNKWYADIQIGIKDTSPGTLYKLTAWLVSVDWVANMIQNSPNHRTWWNDKEPPPGARQVATASVTRNRVANCWK
jgi:hypothetical protein